MLERLKAQILLVQFAVDHPEGGYEKDASIGLDMAQDIVKALEQAIKSRREPDAD